MGLFDRKKADKDSHFSTLTESEIKKKLYGEFEVEPTKIAGGSDRDITRSSPAAVTKTHSVEVVPDLFTVKPAALASQSESAAVSHEARKPELASKSYQSKLPDAQPTKVQFSTPITADSYPRYREFNKESKNAGVAAVLGNILDSVKRLFEAQGLRARQVVYWTSGVFVVFLLLMGINALNVQREQAMRTKYRAPLPQPEAVPPITKNVPPALTESKTTKELSGIALGGSASMITEKTPATSKVIGSTSGVSLEKRSPQQLEAGSYVIQVVTYPNEDYAGGIVTSLKQAGFKAFVRENVRPTGATFYIVMIGGFGSAAEAQQQLKKFKATELARPFADAFVKQIN